MLNQDFVFTTISDFDIYCSFGNAPTIATAQSSRWITNINIGIALEAGARTTVVTDDESFYLKLT